IPDDLKVLYKCTFEIDARWLVEAASRRQKWLDQAQSLNLYMAEASGRKLDELYKLAWKRGLKTTYYLRSMSATHVEKSTITDHRLNAVSNGGGQGSQDAAGGAGAAGADGNGASSGSFAAPGVGHASTEQSEPIVAAAVATGLEAARPTAPKACAIDDPECEACQ